MYFLVGPNHCTETATEAGKNAVHSTGVSVSQWNIYETRDQCIQACCAQLDCYIWTYHTTAFSGTWSKKCVLATEVFMTGKGRKEPSSWIAQANVDSGIIQRGIFKNL